MDAQAIGQRTLTQAGRAAAVLHPAALQRAALRVREPAGLRTPGWRRGHPVATGASRARSARVVVGAEPVEVAMPPEVGVAAQAVARTAEAAVRAAAAWPRNEAAPRRAEDAVRDPVRRAVAPLALRGPVAARPDATADRTSADAAARAEWMAADVPGVPELAASGSAPAMERALAAFAGADPVARRAEFARSGTAAARAADMPATDAPVAARADTAMPRWPVLADVSLPQIMDAAGAPALRGDLAFAGPVATRTRAASRADSSGGRFEADRPGGDNLGRTGASSPGADSFADGAAGNSGADGSDGEAGEPASDQGPSGGTITLDGRLVGHWLAERMGRDAVRPRAGLTGFDAKQAPAWGPSWMS